MRDPNRFSHITRLDSGHVPRWLTIGTITSVPVSKDNRFTQPGVYEMDIDIDEAALEVEGDRYGYVKHTIALHIAGCAKHTGMPKGEGIWQVRLTDEICRRFPALPKEFLA